MNRTDEFWKQVGERKDDHEHDKAGGEPKIEDCGHKCCLCNDKGCDACQPKPAGGAGFVERLRNEVAVFGGSHGEPFAEDILAACDEIKQLKAELAEAKKIADAYYGAACNSEKKFHASWDKNNHLKSALRTVAPAIHELMTAMKAGQPPENPDVIVTCTKAVQEVLEEK